MTFRRCFYVSCIKSSTSCSAENIKYKTFGRNMTKLLEPKNEIVVLILTYILILLSQTWTSAGILLRV